MTTGRTGLRRYLWLFLLLSLGFLALFGVAHSLDLGLLDDPAPFFDRAGWPVAAVLGVFLLAIDVFLPVPASLVMVAHGAVFGIALGTLVSLVGAMTGAAVGFALGRWGRGTLRRWVSDDEYRRATDLLARWGDLAVVVSRPVPVVAESVAILAGTTPIGWRRFLLASSLGNLPAAALYAVTGATAARLDSASLTFGLVMAIAALVWLAGGRLRRSPAHSAGPATTSGACRE